MNDSDNKGRGQPPNPPGSDKTQFQRRSPSVNPATVLKPGAKPNVKPQPATAAKVAPPPLEAAAEIHLTRIRKAIREQDSSRGFMQAKQAADKALTANKIILNHRFVLEATLGAGGMGTVYRAKDLRKVEAQDPNPDVAVKVLNDDFKHHPDAYITLQREASRSHILSHPNIVTVHDFDRDGDVIYMTMELLQGLGLETLIRQNRGKGLAKGKVLKITRDIGLALAYAHQKHIVHSDLKPGNIFVSADGAKVLDFGIARLTNQAANNTDFDAGSLGAMTPAYASLEMIAGEQPHPSDDVYAAAIIVYELLAGVHPYQRKAADVALREKLRPAPLKMLNKQQWRTLEAGLKLKREERLQDITRFYKGLTQKHRSIKGLLLGTVVVSALLATVAYRFFAGNQLDRQITATFEQGQQCLQQADSICAQDRAKAVLQMAPKHIQAAQLLTQARSLYLEQQEAKLLTDFSTCLTQQADANCARQVLQTLQLLSPESAHLDLLNQRIADFIQAQEHQELTEQARLCLQQEDFACVIANAETILSDGDDTVASALLAQAHSAQQQQQQATAQRQLDYQQATNLANQCLQQKDYNCATKQAERAVAAKINAVAARSLLQKIEFTREEYQKNLQKAKNVLAKGRACFNKKNYSCAIANSESALEFIPDYGPGLKLRSEAQSAVEQLKKQIIIE